MVRGDCALTGPRIGARISTNCLHPYTPTSAAPYSGLPAHKRGRLTLSHPDYTVGPGISPSPEVLRVIPPAR
jgi:hypothetical protein